MRPHTRWVAVVSGWGVLLFAAGVTRARAQESHIGSLTGHAAAGKPLYTRYCAGCHGDDGDARGENAQWIDPKPRDFTMAVFKCRSRSEEHTSELQSQSNLVCRLLLEKKKKKTSERTTNTSNNDRNIKDK